MLSSHLQTKRNRSLHPIRDEEYYVIKSIICGETEFRRKNPANHKAYIKLKRYALHVETRCHPLHGTEVQCLIHGKLIVPRTNEVNSIVEHFFRESLGEGSRALYHRIGELFCSITENAVEV